MRELYGKYFFWIFFALSGVMFLFVWAGFIVTPMTNDLKVFMASANQSNYISKNLVVGSFKAWELKSVFSRMLMYLIYKISSFFVLYDSYDFEVLSKFIYSLFIILLAYISMKLIFQKERKRIILGTLLVSVSFMAMHTSCHMQAEMSSSMLILLAFALYLNSIISETNQVLKLLVSGMLIGATFFFKSVLILLSITVVSAICIYAVENGIKLSIKRMMLVAAGSLIMLFIIIVLILLINPEEFRDMMDASTYQSTLLSSPIPIKQIVRQFVNNHLSKIIYSPIVIIGVICFILNFCRNVQRKNWKLILFHITMWLMPAIFILLSNKYFIYHFVVYIFPSLIEIYYAILHRNQIGKFVLLTSLIGVTVWYIAAFSIISTNVKKYIECDIQSYEETDDFLRKINFDKSETCLYLDDGKGAYYLGNPSYLKYFFPLPLERLDEESTLKSHVDSLDLVMNFDGKYISVYDDWFFGEDRYQMIRAKVNSEYEYAGEYYVFSPPHSFHSSDAFVRTYELYEKKQ